MGLLKALAAIISWLIIPAATNNCNEQALNTDSSIITDSSHFEYYHGINQAKRKLLTGDFEGAVENYTNTFRNHKRIDFYDLKNYAIACKKSRVSIKYEYLDLLFYYCNYDTTVLYKLIPKIIFQFEGINPFENLTEDRIKTPINYKFRDGLNQILSNNSQFTRSFLAEVREMEKAPLDERLTNQYIDSINMVHFKSLVAVYGFPHESQTGIMINDSTELYPMLDQFFQRYKIHPETMLYLDQKFLEEPYFPQLYANLFDSSDENNLYRFILEPKYIASVACISDNRLWKPFIYYPNGYLDSVNFRRISIGLDSFHIQQEQVLTAYLCSKEGLGNEKLLELNVLHTIPIIPYGLVTSSFAKEKVTNLKAYLIDVNQMLVKINCDILRY